jgi:hypothetical protein
MKEVTKGMPETILAVGAEGGSESIVRERTAEGEWRFRGVINQLALCEMFPDETEGVPPFLSRSAEAAFADAGGRSWPGKSCIMAVLLWRPWPPARIPA